MVSDKRPTSAKIHWTSLQLDIINNFSVSYTYLQPCPISYNDSIEVNSTSQMIVLSGLQEFSTYSVEVVAVNRAGQSLIAEGINRRTFTTESNGKLQVCINATVYYKPINIGEN